MGGWDRCWFMSLTLCSRSIASRWIAALFKFWLFQQLEMIAVPLRLWKQRDRGEMDCHQREGKKRCMTGGNCSRPCRAEHADKTGNGNGSSKCLTAGDVIWTPVCRSDSLWWDFMRVNPNSKQKIKIASLEGKTINFLSGLLNTTPQNLLFDNQVGFFRL